MEKHDKIYVAGHLGLVGSAIVRNLKANGYHNLLLRTRSELDLIDQHAVADFFSVEKPNYVFLAAAKVGGIMANNIYRADFIYENLQIQNNIIHSAYKSGVTKLLFLGSSCIYPKSAPQPLREDYLLTSELEYTNEPYAIAKIAGIKMCESYNLQYGTNFIAVMPTNLYGPNDNYDLKTSHVLPALIRKIHLGHCLEQGSWKGIRNDLNNLPIEGVDGNSSEEVILSVLDKYGISISSNDRSRVEVTIKLWGSGKPYREFLHVDDLAQASVFLMNKVDFKDVCGTNMDSKGEAINTHINIGTGTDLSIKELAELIKGIVGFNGQLVWDSSNPDGTFRKLLDVSKIKKLGWNQQIRLFDGIANCYSDFNSR